MARPRPGRRLWLGSIWPSAAPFSQQGQQPLSQGEVKGGGCFRPWEMGQLGSGLCPGGGRHAWKPSTSGLTESSLVLAEFIGLEKPVG